MRASRMRLLLLNPPAPVPVFRDCYCSGYTKGRLAVHPLDLQVQSGFFRDAEFHVEYLDAVQEGLTARETLSRIGSFAPDAVLALVGDVVLEHDARLLAEIRDRSPRCRLFISGDIARFCPQDALERMPAVDGILVDFTSPGLLAHLQGGSSSDLTLRGDRIANDGPRAGSYEHPLPRADVVGKYRRRLPFFRVPEYYSILTSFGCPYSCLYCNAHCVGYRTRELDDVIRELHHAADLGYASLYVRDATFFFDRERARTLLEAWQRSGLTFEWMCFSRPDLIDEEIATIAARLGCRLIMLGVESFDESCLSGLSRHLPIEVTRRAFRILRQSRIPAAAQLIAGLRRLGSDGRLLGIHEYEADLTSFLSALDPDHISFSIYHPRPGVPQDSAVLEALAKEGAACERLIRRVTRHFYTQPRRILRQAASIRSLAQLAHQAGAAAHLLFPPRPPARGIWQQPAA